MKRYCSSRSRINMTSIAKKLPGSLFVNSGALKTRTKRCAEHISALDLDQRRLSKAAMQASAHGQIAECKVAFQSNCWLDLVFRHGRFERKI